MWGRDRQLLLANDVFCAPCTHFPTERMHSNVHLIVIQRATRAWKVHSITQNVLHFSLVLKSPIPVIAVAYWRWRWSSSPTRANIDEHSVGHQRGTGQQQRARVTAAARDAAAAPWWRRSRTAGQRAGGAAGFSVLSGTAITARLKKQQQQ